MSAPVGSGGRTAKGSARFVSRGRNPWVGDGRDGRHTRHTTVWAEPPRSAWMGGSRKTPHRVAGTRGTARTDVRVRQLKLRVTPSLAGLFNAIIVGLAVAAVFLCVTKGWNW